MAQIDQIFNIVGGPGKWDLLTAFGNATNGQFVEFEYTSDSGFKLRTSAIILSLAHEGHTGKDWGFTATVKMGDIGCRISGHYNTHSHNGKFTLIA